MIEFKNFIELAAAVSVLSLAVFMVSLVVISYTNEAKYQLICDELSSFHRITYCDYKIRPDKTTYWTIKQANRGQ